MQKKAIRLTCLIFVTAVFTGLCVFWGMLTGDLQLPSELTHSAWSAETIYAKVTADLHVVDLQLTAMASELAATPIPSPSSHSRNWLERFLRQPTCRIPCWENITPNATDIRTAQRIAAGIPGVRVIYLEDDRMSWYFNDESGHWGNLIADQAGTVVQIDLTVSDDQTLLLQDVVRAFGKPHAVLAGIDCDAMLSYRYKGMLLFIENLPCGPRPAEVKPGSAVKRIILFTPANEEYTLNIFRFNMNEILWDGYRTYDFSHE